MSCLDWEQGAEGSRREGLALLWGLGSKPQEDLQARACAPHSQDSVTLPHGMWSGEAKWPRDSRPFRLGQAGQVQ